MYVLKIPISISFCVHLCTNSSICNKETGRIMRSRKSFRTEFLIEISMHYAHSKRSVSPEPGTVKTEMNMATLISKKVG